MFFCVLFNSKSLMCDILINWASIWPSLKPFSKFNIDSIWLEFNSTQLKLTQVKKSDSSWVKLQPYMIYYTVTIIVCTIGNNYHNFSELPQLVIFFMNCQNCDYLTKFLQLVKTVTIGQNYPNWSKLSQLVKIVTIGVNCHNLSKLW